MKALKNYLLQSPVRPIYLSLANTFHSLRDLFIYPSTAKVGKTDYDAYWNSKFESKRGILSVWRLRRAQAFAAIVHQGDTVLDIGVGDGAILKYLIDQRQIIGYGLDISDKAVQFCRENGLNVELADANKPVEQFIQQPFDYIILSEIIEHIPEPETLLERLRPFALKGIIVSIPNTGYIKHRLRLLFGKFPLQWLVTPGEHLRFWTYSDFRWWAEQINFRIIKAIPYEGINGLKAVYPGLFASAFVYLLEKR